MTSPLSSTGPYRGTPLPWLSPQVSEWRNRKDTRLIALVLPVEDNRTVTSAQTDCWVSKYGKKEREESGVCQFNG
jgi:hypothetical protein